MGRCTIGSPFPDRPFLPAGGNFLNCILVDFPEIEWVIRQFK